MLIGPVRTCSPRCVPSDDVCETGRFHAYVIDWETEHATYAYIETILYVGMQDTTLGGTRSTERGNRRKYNIGSRFF
jgi:hypothetical protein